MQPTSVQNDVPLAPLTTLQVGGAARAFAKVQTPQDLAQVLRWSAAEQLPTLILGGGSNLLVADTGYPGLVVQTTRARWSAQPHPGGVWVRAEAGLVWDQLCEATCAQGLSGLECLSGIPGWVGAVPIQNVGAYGQEIGDTLVDVEVVHRLTGEVKTLAAPECGLGYRHSHFKGPWRDLYVVTAVRFNLRRAPPTPVRSAELQAALAGADASNPTVVRAAVLQVRRKKSMVWDPADPNHRSAGSFFMNPVIDAGQAEALQAEYGAGMPAYPAHPGHTKLSAAWLIEHAGLHKGFALPAGLAALSTQHTLAITNRGQARAADIVALAAHVRRTVWAKFAVRLVPEAQGVGFDVSLDALLDGR